MIKPSDIKFHVTETATQTAMVIFRDVELPLYVEKKNGNDNYDLVYWTRKTIKMDDFQSPMNCKVGYTVGGCLDGIKKENLKQEIASWLSRPCRIAESKSSLKLYAISLSPSNPYQFNRSAWVA